MPLQCVCSQTGQHVWLDAQTTKTTWRGRRFQPNLELVGPVTVGGLNGFHLQLVSRWKRALARPPSMEEPPKDKNKGKNTQNTRKNKKTNAPRKASSCGELPPVGPPDSAYSPLYPSSSSGGSSATGGSTAVFALAGVDVTVLLVSSGEWGIRGAAGGFSPAASYLSENRRLSDDACLFVLSSAPA